MAEKSFPFAAVNEDRKYSAADWAAYFSQFITNGVFPVGSQLLVTAGTGMQVNVSAGGAWINGYGYVNGSAYTLNIGAADGVLNRIDRIVVRWGRVERAIFLDVRKGTPASSPAAPTLTRDADYYDLCIAQISVPAGITAIVSGHITDKRLDPTACGIVSSLITPDTSGWYEGWEAEYQTWLEGIQGLLEGDPATTLASAVSTLQSEVGTIQADIDAIENTATARITAGTAPAFTVADSTVTSYYPGLRRTITAHADSGANPTLNFNGKGAKSVLIATGKAAKWLVGQHVMVEYDGTSFFVCSAGGGIELPVTIEVGTVLLFWKAETFQPQLSTYADGWFSFKAVKAGTYRITYTTSRHDSSGYVYVKLQKNGVDVAASEMITNVYYGSKTIDVALNTNDELHLLSKQGGGVDAIQLSVVVRIRADDLQSGLDEIAYRV